MWGMRKMFLLVACGLFGFTLAEETASDAATTNRVAELPSILVVASPVTQEEQVSKDGVETVSISREQLDNLNAQDLQTALRQVPGVAVSRYSAIGSYGGAQGGSIYIRGLGTARPGGEVRTYTDGAPRESGVWGHPLMDAMPIDFAQALSVQKNPHPGDHAGTFGAVDVETKRRREQGQEGEVVHAFRRRAFHLARKLHQPALRILPRLPDGRHSLVHRLQVQVLTRVRATDPYRAKTVPQSKGGQTPARLSSCPASWK